MAMSPHRRKSRLLLAAGILFLAAKPSIGQDDVQGITIACQASLREIVFWCVNIAQADGAVPSPVEQESNCREAKQRSDRYCYPLQVPQLGCTSALQEMEIWCGGKATFNLTDIVSFCRQSQRNVRVFCYR